MFHLWQDKRIKTWNPFVGCRFNCSYCWARRIAKRLNCIYCRVFSPHLHEERLNAEKIPKNGVVFVSDMGDLWWAEPFQLEKILNAVKEIQEKYPASFFFETKRPLLYYSSEWDVLKPEKTIFSTTIETNRDEIEQQFTKAPPPWSRYNKMLHLPWSRKHISIEPIMDFDLKPLFKWVTDIEPECVSIGYDNYNNNLPEPPLEKTLKLIQMLEDSGIKVEKKTLKP